MPRLLVNFRKRHMAESYFASCLVGLIAADNLVEDIDGILYLLASIGFIIGSVFFLPSIEEDRYPGYNIGEYLFIVASVLLLWISISDFVEAYKAATKSKEQAAAEAAAFFNASKDGDGNGKKVEMDGTGAERHSALIITMIKVHEN